jgi:hypothetical protein
VKALEPGPERHKAMDEFWNTAYRKYRKDERELIRARRKVLAEYVGLLDEERLR